MAAPQSSPLPEAPTRGEAEGQFVPKANAFVGALEPFRQQLQAQADYVNTRTSQLEQAATRAENAESGALDAEATSAANANFAGNWSSLSGSYSVPTSVFHEGYYWALVQNVSSIGDHEPGESSAWVIIQRAFRELSVEPTLSSNFRTGEHKLYGVQDGYKSRDLADIWDVTRASGETVLTPAGRIATVGPDTLPLTYVPETGGLGAQVYGQVTNLTLGSNNFDGSQDWGENGAATVTEEVSNALLSGESSWLVEGASSMGFVDSNLRGSVVIPTDQEVTYSLWVYPLDGQLTQMILRSNSDALGYNNSAILVPVEPGRWQRISAQAARTTSALVITVSNAGGLPFLATAAQVEVGATPNVYVPTTTSTVTKPATNVSRELGEEFNAAEGTVLIDVGVEGVRKVIDGFATAIVSWGAPNRSNTFALYTSRTGRDSLFVRLYSVAGEQTLEVGSRVLSGLDSGQLRVAVSYNSVTGMVSAAALGSMSSARFDFSQYSVAAPQLLLDKLGVVEEWIYSTPKLFSDVTYIPRALSDAELVEWTRG